MQMPLSALPPLNALRHFEAVARHGSFAAAAVDLHVTHWAVGKQIRALEDWFGVPLFERRATGVVLTDQGAALLDDVAGAFSRLSAAAQRVRGDRPVRRISGRVRVNALASLAVHWLLPRLGAFEAGYPEVDVRLSTTSRKLRYIGDAYDVGIRAGHDAVDPGDRTAGIHPHEHALMPDLRLPVCSPALLHRIPIHDVVDLRNHTLLHSASTRAGWSRWLNLAGTPELKPARHVEFEHTYLQLTAAVEGLGVALMSMALVQRDLAAGRLTCPIVAPVLRADDYTLMIHPDRADDPAVRAFVDWITAAAADGNESTD